MNIVEEVWFKAVMEFESDLLRHCPTLTGGKKGDESAEMYAERCIRVIETYIERLTLAKDELRKVKGKK